MDQSHIPGLDGLRAIAILLVIAYHSLGTLGARLGVSLFFVLSGFLITWLLLKEHEKHGDVSLKGFYIRRSLRIFPAYYAFLFLVIGIEIFQRQEEIFNYISPASLYYINYYSALNGSHPALQHLWSLSVEEQFYLLWPLFFLILFKLGKRPLVYGTLAIIGMGFAWRVYAYSSLGLEERWIYRAFDSRFDNLAIGCLLAICVFTPRLRAIIEKYAVSIFLIPILIGLLIISRTPELIGDSFKHYSYTLGFTFEGLMLAILLINVVAFHNHVTLKWVSSRVLVFIGILSYPMYLYHELAAGVAHKVSDKIEASTNLTMGMGLTAIVGLALTIFLAWCSFRLIEKPFLKLKNRFH